MPGTEQPQRCAATGRVEGEAVHCDLPKGHDGQHQDFVEGMRWSR